jgi:hypothetical protein
MKQLKINCTISIRENGSSNIDYHIDGVNTVGDFIQATASSTALANDLRAVVNDFVSEYARIHKVKDQDLLMSAIKDLPVGVLKTQPQAA